MPYTSAADDILFILDNVAGFETYRAASGHDAADPETLAAILTEAAGLSDNVIAPLQTPGDQYPAVLENGVVRASPGYADGYRALSEGGWVGMIADPDYGGMGLPTTVAMAVHEMLAGACLSLQLNPLLTQGQIEALEHHASDEIKRIYLPKLISGEWTGTMNLTEPQAGSDLNALKSRAEPVSDGSYRIFGQKI